MMQRSARVSKKLKPENFSLGLKKARKSLDLDIPNFETNEGIISVSVLREKKPVWQITAMMNFHHIDEF